MIDMVVERHNVAKTLGQIIGYSEGRLRVAVVKPPRSCDLVGEKNDSRSPRLTDLFSKVGIAS